MSLFALVLAVVVVVTTSRPAQAITLVPPSLEFSVRPGDTVKTKIKLYNEKSEAADLAVSTANFSAKGEEGDPNFNFTGPITDLASWIRIEGESFAVGPNEAIEVPVTISIPPNAEPGGHYAGLFFGTNPNKNAEGNTVQLATKIGSLVIIRVEGDIRESALIKSFTIAPNVRLNRLPANVVIRIQNNGNVHVRPTGTVTIRNMFGGVSTTMPLNPKDGAILPNSVRKFDMIWKKDEEKHVPGNFFTELGKEAHNFALGSYTAEVTATYGATDKSLSGTVQFTVIPWRFLFTLVLLIALIVFLLIWGIKRYNRMIIHRIQSSSKRSGK